MSLQHRTAVDADRAPTRRRLNFSTPLSASLVVVVVIAVVATAILLGPRGLFGIGAASPSPGTPTPPPSPTLPLESPTVAPTASPSLTPTIAPTPPPAPTPAPPAAWTGLEWASGPSLPLLGDGMLPRIEAVTWWGGRYLGVGSVLERGPLIPPSEMRIAPAFFVAEAGSDWRLVQQGEWEDVAVQDSDYATLAHLVDLGDEVLAFSDDSPVRGSPSLWSSSDGLSWSLVASASWTEVWGPGTLTAVDGGPFGVVAIGFEGGGCCNHPAGVPVVAHSSDGRAWRRISSPSMGDRALLNDVAATQFGFVIVGTARAPEGLQLMMPEVGAPAAWRSTDGLTWEAAQVDGTEVVGGGLMQLAVAADGLNATGIAEPNPFPWEGPTYGWWSADGRAWTNAGALGTDLPPGRVIASDGTRMISFGRANPATTELAAWSSTNGSSWSQLTLAGGMPAISAAWIVPDGVLTTGDAWWYGAAVP